MNSNKQSIAVPASLGEFALKVTHSGKETMIYMDWGHWPYRYAVEDGPEGRRLTRRGSALAGIRAVNLVEARNIGTPLHKVVYMRVVWFVDDVVEFSRRWVARDQETFPHFVEKPEGTK
jgi:hypothetical protein